MITKNRKIIAIVLLVLVTVLLFIAFVYINAINENDVPKFYGILFAILPALAVNTIWNRKTQKEKK